jgi:RNA polymerase sigma-70 factor (ECF subfamily)
MTTEIDDGEDEQFAARARMGDRPAFERLVRRHQDRAFRFILRMIGSRDEAMDLTQETFLKAYRALPDWRSEARFSTWLFQIARNTALDALRRRRHTEFVSLTAGHRPVRHRAATRRTAGGQAAYRPAGTNPARPARRAARNSAAART